MKEIVVISGKGGTGKTSITASFAQLGGGELVVADCDVDAADLHLLLQPQDTNSSDFFSGYLADIQPEKCTGCGLCADICRFDAIHPTGDVYRVNRLDCEGCGYCARICPTEAIEMEEQNVGQWYFSQTRIGSPMVHARLGIGAENSGKLVARVKKEARAFAGKNGQTLVLVDGSPGIGCPVVSSLSGADLAVLITEPTVSGLHDLKRVYQLVAKFRIPAACIINKSDLNSDVTREILSFLKKENIVHLANIPYNENFTRAMTTGKTIVEYENGDLKSTISDSWKKILTLIAGEK